MKKRCLLLIMLALLIAVTGLVSITSMAAAADKKIEISLGHAVEPSENYAHLTCVKFKEYVENYTDGAVTVNIYPAGQLGGEQDLIRSIQMGTVQAALVAINNFNVYSPSIGYYSLPFMFADVNEFRNITDAMWNLNNMWATKESACRLLSIAEINFRQLTNSKREVKTLADLKGLRIRVPKNKIMINAFKGFGVEPVSMAWAEVFTAMQVGVLDGQENSYNIIRSQKFSEVQKYITEIGYIAHSACMVIGEKFFQGLSADQQQAIVQAGKDAMLWERGFSDKMLDADKEYLKSKGMVLTGPPEDLDEWVKGAKKSWVDAYEIIGGGDKARGKAVIDMVSQLKTVLP